jgi:sulfite exporter TauE/SafE
MKGPPARAILFLALIFAIANYTAAQDPGTWKLVEGILLMVVFAAGCWILLRQSITQSAVNHTESARLNRLEVVMKFVPNWILTSQITSINI